jgi:hypothetical protein
MRTGATPRRIETVFTTASETAPLVDRHRSAHLETEPPRDRVRRESTDHPGLVGRESELALIETMLEHSVDRGSVLIIQGEPGVGKSTLLDAAARTARQRDLLVLRTTGVEIEAEMPFAGLHQMLGPLLSAIGGLTEKQRNALLEAFGSAPRTSSGVVIAQAALELLIEKATSRPVLIIADDAHWLDASTIQVLLFIARRLETERIVLLVGSRGEIDPALNRDDLPEMTLSGLDPQAAEELLASLLPGTESAARERTLAEAGGNPLALLELPLSLATSPESPNGEIPLTPRLQRAFAGQAASLPTAPRTVLLVGAVHDSDSLPEIIAASAKLLDPDHAEGGLHAAQESNLVSIDGDKLRFRHPLIRSALRQSATLAHRSRAHAALAETLAEAAERQLWHRSASVLDRDERVAEELDAGAALVQQRPGGAPVALAALRRAAAISVNQKRRVARLLEAAELAVELGRPIEVAQLLNDAERVGLAPIDRCRMLTLQEWIAESTGLATISSMIRIADQLRSAGQVHFALDALFVAALKCVWSAPDPSACDAVLCAADDVGASECDPKLLAIFALIAPAQRAAIVIEQASRILATDLARDRTARRITSTSLEFYAMALTALPELDLAAEFIAQAAEGLRNEGRLGVLTRVMASQAVVARELGDWDTAAIAAEEGIALGRKTGEDRQAAVCHLVLGMIAGNRGDHKLSESLIAAAERTLETSRIRNSLAMVQASRAVCATAAGEHEKAFAHARRPFDPKDAAFHPSHGVWGLMDLAYSGLLSGNAQQARTILDSLDLPECSAVVRRHMSYARALLAPDDEAAGLFRKALLVTPPGVPFGHARVQLAYGTWLRRRRRRSDARIHLRSASEIFDTLGAIPWTKRAQSELRASGETRRRRTPDCRDDLSPQERQVTQLVAEGLTNREIAARLFLSHRTVSSHLYRIFRKLDISSRSELGDTLRRIDGD